jgi:hypothetical protein
MPDAAPHSAMPAFVEAFEDAPWIATVSPSTLPVLPNDPMKAGTDTVRARGISERNARDRTETMSPGEPVLSCDVGQRRVRR